MAAKIPVLLCVDGEARRIVEDSNCGLFVEPENSVMLAEKVKLLVSQPKLLIEYGQNGNRIAKEQFDRNVVIKNFFNQHLNGSL
jgi:glycosyltransferase involved in cell wall biosynthesis